jgi:hypothetical protein
MIEFFLDKLTIPADKALHFFYGFLVFNATYWWLGVGPGLTITLIVALLKEAYDSKHKKHTASLLDIFFTMLPAIIQLGVVLIVVNMK